MTELLARIATSLERIADVMEFKKTRNPRPAVPANDPHRRDLYDTQAVAAALEHHRNLTMDQVISVTGVRREATDQGTKNKMFRTLKSIGWVQRRESMRESEDGVRKVRWYRFLA